MIRTDSIDNLCRALRRQHPDWKIMQERFETLPTFKKKKEYQLHQYAKDFSELYLDVALECIAKEVLLGKIQFFPRYDQKIPLENGNYKLFHNGSGRMIIEDNASVRWEYDQIILLENVPTFLEIKIRQWDTGKNRKRKQRDGTYTLEKDSCVRNSLRPEIYSQKLNAVRGLFDQEVGYVMIISKDQFNYTFNNSDRIVNRFLSDNGRIVPFYTDRLTFREHVKQKVQELGYPLKEDPVQPPRIYLP